jgi:hypothetical protein
MATVARGFCQEGTDLQKSELDGATVKYLAAWTYYLALAFGPPADTAARMGKLLVTPRSGRQQLVYCFRVTFASCFSKNLNPAKHSGRTS